MTFFHEPVFGDSTKKSKLSITGSWPDITICLDGEPLDKVSELNLNLRADSIPEVEITLRPTEIDIDIETLRSLLLRAEGKIK